MGTPTPQENFDTGVRFRLAGNEAFKKQDYKKGTI
jgi:tetratricopeptide (TPR) repeat protein